MTALLYCWLLCNSNSNNYNKRNLSYLSLEGINNELKSLRLDTLDTFLYHMVSILVLYTLQNVAIQLTDNVALKCRKEQKQYYHFIKRKVTLAA